MGQRERVTVLGNQTGYLDFQHCFHLEEQTLRPLFLAQKVRRPFRSVANGRAAGGNQWVRRSNFVELRSDMSEVTPTGSERELLY